MVSDILADKTLDTRGEICPISDIRVRTMLDKMEKGQVLEVLVYYPLSVERVPRNAEQRKHMVLKVERVGDGSE